MSESESPEPGIELAPGVRAPEVALRIQFSRSSGPGGQNVNKVNTRAELWLELTAIIGMSAGAMSRLQTLAGRKITQAGELHLTSSSERTAEANRHALFDRLREMIVAASVQPRRRRKTRPSRASKAKRLQSKRHRATIKSNRRIGEEN